MLIMKFSVNGNSIYKNQIWDKYLYYLKENKNILGDKSIQQE